MFDLKQGFHDGAREVLTENAPAGSARDNSEALDLDTLDDEAEDELEALLTSGDELSDPDAHSIFLTVEIQFEQHLIEECVTQAAHSLREVALRLEKGEEEGTIFNKDGEEIGRFDLMPEEIGP